MQNRSLPSRCIVGTGFLKSSFNYGDSGHETRMQSIWFHARRSLQVSAHRYLKRLRSAIRKSAEALFMDSLSVWLCCFKRDAIQIMQFCSLALNSPDHQYRPSKSSKPMPVKSLCDSFGWLPSNLHFTEKSHGRKFNVIYSAIKLFWFANNFSFARADPLTHTASEYRAGCGPPWLSLTRNQPVFCSARPTRAERSALQCALALNMNLDTRPSSSFRSRWMASRAPECRPPDHHREPKTGQVRD